MKQNSKYFGRSKMLDALHGTTAAAVVMEMSPRRIDHGGAPIAQPRMDLQVSRKMAPALFTALTGLKELKS